MTIYGIAPKTIGTRKETDKTELKKVVETTGGTFYIESSETTVSSVIDNIEQQQKTLIKGQKETRKIDKPQIPFVMLVISIVVLFILNKKVNL